MDTQVKDKWVKALRSGDYNQAQGMLMKVEEATGEVEGYCCLGVLAKVCGNEPRIEFEPAENNTYPAYYYVMWPSGVDVANELPSSEFLEPLGLTRLEVDKLVNMNDEEEADFSAIADFIEENL